MANTVIAIRSSGVTGNTPSLGVLANGELSLNFADGILYYKSSSNTLGSIRTTAVSGLTTEVQFNDAGSFGANANFTFNKTSGVLSAKNIVISGNSYFGNSNLHEGITQLSVTNSGASAYLFDQYSGNNPSIYVGAGQTISFNLNVSGHPFVIRESSGGANTSAGLTHISTTGDVSTGVDAQGKVSGILFWKIPFDLIGSTYVYQCTIHGGMVGNIVIQQPASFVAANTTLAFNQANGSFNAANAAFNTANGSFNAANAAFNTANAAFSVANGASSVANTDFTTLTTTAGVYGNSSHVPVTTLTANGRISLITNTAIQISADAITSGILSNTRGGTGTTTSTGTGSVVLNTSPILSNVSVSSVNVTNTTASTSNATGALTVQGGIGVKGNVATDGIIFADGTRQTTASAGGGGTTDQYARDTANAAFTHANSAFNAANTGGGGSANSFGQIIANVGTIFATTANDSLQIIGESGISVSSNVSAKKVIVSVPAGFTFTTADYGFVTDSTNVIYDYGTL